jgi:D-sedoheptulose 7-phosphate isomerase
MDAAIARIGEILEATISLHERVRRMDLAPAALAVEAIVTAFGRGGQLFVFGNGGSAADAQHMSSELVGRFQKHRKALPAVALTTDTSILTSVTNDYSFDRVFARQIEALGKAGDVALGISTSGRSPNVLTALETAKAGGLYTVALTGGDGGAVGAAAETHINVPDASTARVQEVHRTLIHAMCELIEDSVTA